MKLNNNCSINPYASYLFLLRCILISFVKSHIANTPMFKVSLSTFSKLILKWIDVVC